MSTLAPSRRPCSANALRLSRGTGAPATSSSRRTRSGGRVQLELSNHCLLEVTHICVVMNYYFCVVGGGLPRKDMQAVRAGAADVQAVLSAAAGAEGLWRVGRQQRQRRPRKQRALG